MIFLSENCNDQVKQGQDEQKIKMIEQRNHATRIKSPKKREFDIGIDFDCSRF